MLTALVLGATGWRPADVDRVTGRDQGKERTDVSLGDALLLHDHFLTLRRMSTGGSSTASLLPVCPMLPTPPQLARPFSKVCPNVLLPLPRSVLLLSCFLLCTLPCFPFSLLLSWTSRILLCPPVLFSVKSKSTPSPVNRASPKRRTLNINLYNDSCRNDLDLINRCDLGSSTPR